MTTNNTTTATLNNDLLSYLKGAEVGMAIVAINLRGAADRDGELQGMAEVAGTIRGLLGELIEDLVDRMDADQAVEDAIAEVDREAEASMMEAAGAAVMEAINDKRLNMMYNPGALAEALASDSDELASKEADRLKAADEAVVEAMRERLLENAAWAAANPDLATHGFVLNVLWVSRYEILERERSALISGCPGAVSANIIWLREEHFWGKGKDLVRFMQAEAARLDADIVAGEFSPEQMFYVGLEIGWGEGDAYGLRIGFRKDDGSFKVTMI
jgi:hypothetical protein